MIATRKDCMKNLFLILVLIMLTLPSLAGGVGYIDYDKVISEYNFAKASLTQIENKAKEIEQYLQDKEEEFSKLESPVQRKKFEDNVRDEMKTKETAFNDFREKREEVIIIMII